MFAGFREFLLRGNVIDLAVAVVIGAAFTAVVNALVTSVINPLIGERPEGAAASSRALPVEATGTMSATLDAVALAAAASVAAFALKRLLD